MLMVLHRTPDPSPLAATAGQTVAVFCNTFLPYSQTFIWDEVRCHERFQVELFAWRRRNPDRFPHPVRLARPWFPITRRDNEFDRRFASGGINLVHAHFGWAGALAVRFSRRHDLPLVVSFHGYDVSLLVGSGLGPPLVWPYTLRARELLKHMSLGLCASRELRELLLEVGVPANRLVEHRLGVDLERFHSGQRDASVFNIAMVGRFVEKKGFSDGLRAFARFVERTQCPSLLTVVGTGPLGGELHDQAEALGVASRTRFLGELPHETVAGLLATADVLLAPSAVARNGDRDSGLMTVKEASACECVPVTTRHGGIPSIVDDGMTGYLVEEHDIEGLADRLGSLAADVGMRRSMGSAARKKMMQEFELRSSVRILEEIYEDVIRRHMPTDKLSVHGVDSSPSSQ